MNSRGSNARWAEARPAVADRQRRMAIDSVGSRVEHLALLVTEHRELVAHVEAGAVRAFAEGLDGHLTRTHVALLGGAR